MRRLLIVEDDQNILDYLVFALSGIPNLDLFQTSTIISARAMLIENQFDAVLLDLGLPDGNGLDLIESDVFPNNIPIFILDSLGIESMRRLLIVEDDQNILDYLVFALSGIPNLDLFQTSTIISARAMLIENQFDAVLLDLGLPDGNGLDLIESDVFPNNIPIFILTAAIDRDMIVRSIMAGARGYLTKDMPVDAIKNAVEDLLAGTCVMSPSATRLLMSYVKKESSNRASDFSLSKKEQEVLSLIRVGCTYVEIADNLNIALSTVQSHIKNIYSKLGVTNKMRALQKVYG